LNLLRFFPAGRRKGHRSGGSDAPGGTYGTRFAAGQIIPRGHRPTILLKIDSRNGARAGDTDIARAVLGGHQAGNGHREGSRFLLSSGLSRRKSRFPNPRGPASSSLPSSGVGSKAFHGICYYLLFQSGTHTTQFLNARLYFDFSFFVLKPKRHQIQPTLTG